MTPTLQIQGETLFSADETRRTRSNNSMAYGFRKEGDSKDEWLTPPHILKALGQFDLDPCSPVNRPWPTAEKHLTIQDNGLSQPWDGRVFCNPPYSDSGPWLQRCAEHRNAIALIFARTETETWFRHIWDEARGILFIKGRLTFAHVSGKLGKHNSGAPSCLVAYGAENLHSLFVANAQTIDRATIPGKVVVLKGSPCS